MKKIMKRTLALVLVCVMLAGCLSSCGAQTESGAGNSKMEAGQNAGGNAGKTDGAGNADDNNDKGAVEESTEAPTTTETPTLEIPEYETDEVEEDACFGTDQEAYCFELEIDTFEEEFTAYISDVEREGDWMRLSRGDLWFELAYRSQENAEEFLNSVLEYQMVQWFLKQSEKEPGAEFREYMHELTKPVVTDKYETPTVMVGEQECMVTVYEYPVRFSMLGGEDVLDLVVIYRVDMPNGDALFLRGMRAYRYTMDYLLSQALDIWAIDTGAGETMDDIDVEHFKKYAAEYIVDPEEGVHPDILMECAAFELNFPRVEDGLCEILETLVITVE